MGAISLNLENLDWIFKNSMTILQLQLVVFLSSIAIVHVVLKHFGVSKFSCQLIVGLIFGCSWKCWDAVKLAFFTVENEDVLGLFVYFGYTLFLFICTVKIDLVRALRADKRALYIGIPAFVVPFLSGYIILALFPNGITTKQRRTFPSMIGYHTQTAFPVVTCLISEMKMVNSEVGRLVLSSALVSNMFSLVTMIASSTIVRMKETPSRALAELGGVIVLFLSIWFIFRSFMLRILKHTPVGKPVKQSSVQSIIFFALLSCVLFSFTGLSGLTGPYILGLAIPEAAPLASALVNRVESFVMNVFLPMLVVVGGLRANLSEMTTAFDTPFTKLNVIMFCVTYLIKLITCLLSSLYCKLPFKEALAVSLMITCKGVVELIVYARASDNQSISHILFGYLMLGLLVVATVVPIAVRFFYDPSSKYTNSHNKDILHLKPNSELRVVTCIHRDENVHEIIHLLNISCPTTNNPITIYVLHLIELVGRTNPILIDHRSQKHAFNEAHSYSENIIFPLNRYEKYSDGAVHVQCFTEVSPNKLIQNDICTLAFDNDASLIILPFHRTWTTDGLSFEDDNMIRTLNSMVLEKAPCSVGILANRGNLRIMAPMASPENTSKYLVCMIYLGGSDDREAISYASRMSKDSRVELTVLRLKCEEDGSDNWEDMLNLEIIRHFKLHCAEEGTTRYIEENAEDGPETASIIKKIVNDYDLIIVGRRHGLKAPQTDGLNYWNVFPELGILGDLIVSADVNGKASVLSIQHQIE